jgi:Spy/CpxP family protein refolding chaperone
MIGRHAKWPLAGVLGGLVILATGLAPGDAHPTRHGVRTERQTLRQQLGLTDDQVQAIREILGRQRTLLRETGRALWDARRELRAMALGDADDGALATKRAELQELVGRLTEARTQTLREIAAVLTPEQREHLKALQPFRRHRPLAG